MGSSRLTSAVLTAVLAAEPNDETLKLVLTSAAGISSDYQKAQVLVTAADKFVNHGSSSRRRLLLLRGGAKSVGL